MAEAENGKQQKIDCRWGWHKKEMQLSLKDKGVWQPTDSKVATKKRGVGPR